MGSAESSTVLPSGTVTFLFTDVEGSTRLWALDRTAMSASLRVHDAILREAIEAHGGYVFTTAGDSFSAAFSRASSACSAAVDAQRKLAGVTWPGPVLAVRMGLHLGEAEERAGDYFGPTVNTASRVEAAGHGGQVLVTDVVRVAADLRDVIDLGCHGLRDVAEPVHLFQIGTAVFPPLRVIDLARTNLPTRPSSIVGRDAEADRIRRLLDSARLVTLAAVGGAGKTRLAVAVGEAELQHRSGGVWFADLTSISTGAAVEPAIAAALGLNLSAGKAGPQIITYLSDKQSLLILDNCEHVIDECASFAEQFLARPGPAVLLTTSREALDIDGEHVVPLKPLATDTIDSPAVRLFVDRAVAAGAERPIDEATLAVILEVCSRLDGMPLAIELAAARSAQMTPGELLDGLDDRFRLLSGARRRSRQRTLEATLDWSYDLLDHELQWVFRRLGVFVDGFDLDAVAAVTELQPHEARRQVERLMSKSLVARSDTSSGTRFRLLETVKAYAEDRLADAGESEAARDAQLAHFHALATANGVSGFGTLDVGRRLRHDIGNLTAVVRWAEAGQHWEVSAELAVMIVDAFMLETRIPEYAALLSSVRAHSSGIPPDVDGLLSARQWNVALKLFDVDTAISVGAQLSKSPLGEVRRAALLCDAFLLSFIDAQQAEAILLSADEMHAGDNRAHDDEGSFAGWELYVRAVIDFQVGRHHDAAQRAHEFMHRHRSSELAVLVTLAAMGEVLVGEPARALTTLHALEELNLPWLDGTDVKALAHLALGDTEAAAGHIHVHARRSLLDRFPGESADTVLLLAALAHHEGDDDNARTLLMNLGALRQPATDGYARHLAAELAISEEYAARSNDPEYFAQSPARSMRTLKAELARRGWT